MPSTASPVMEVTSSTAAMKKLKSVMTGTPASTPDGKNLWIEIKVGSDFAEFDCRENEHAGAHKNRNVTFRASQDCSLRFTNVAVFRREWVELKARRTEVLAINNDTNATTEYAVYVPAPASTTKEAKANVVNDPKIVVPMAMSLNDPKIVVP